MEKPANAVETWYLKQRGIHPETLRVNGVVTDDVRARWKVSRSPEVYKVRVGFSPGTERKFFYEPAGEPLSAWHLKVRSADILKPVIVCEGETDAMRLWQEGGKDLYGSIVALPGCNAITKEVAAGLAKRSAKTQLYFVLDNEKDKTNGDYNPDDWKDAKHPVAKVDDAWKKIKTFLPQARRIRLPEGFKDVCEYFESFNIKDFDEGVLHAEARYNFDRLDLSVAGRKPEYLWHGMFPRGQFGLLQGTDNVGKSLVYEGLAVALANGDESFLGHRLNPVRGGKVMIADEENPEEVLRERFPKIGLRPDAFKNIFIASQQGLRLDVSSIADKFFEDVSNFQPDLVILDSFVRLHEEDENNSGAVARMYNSAILPLSRQLGCTVLLIHHTNKSSSDDSRKRTRGSSDITAGLDFGWEMVDEVGEVPMKRLSRFKTRSGSVRKDVYFRFEDTDSGGIEFPLMTTAGDEL